MLLVVSAEIKLVYAVYVVHTDITLHQAQQIMDLTTTEKFGTRS